MFGKIWQGRRSIPQRLDKKPTAERVKRTGRPPRELRAPLTGFHIDRTEQGPPSHREDNNQEGGRHVGAAQEYAGIHRDSGAEQQVQRQSGGDTSFTGNKRERCDTWKWRKWRKCQESSWEGETSKPHSWKSELDRCSYIGPQVPPKHVNSPMKSSFNSLHESKFQSHVRYLFPTVSARQYPSRSISETCREDQ